MKSKLKHIANIQTGVFARPSASGDVVYLQARDFDDLGNLQKQVFPDLKSEEINDKHLLKYKDILFAAKGARNFSACFKEKDIQAVASTSFFTIRLNDDNILPEYISWFLNHPDTMTFLKQNARGTSTASISKAVLAELEISIPDLNTQQVILKIHELRQQEKAILIKIEALRNKVIDQRILKAIE